MVEGARLELVYGATHRGFESLPLCHKIPQIAIYSKSYKILNLKNTTYILQSKIFILLPNLLFSKENCKSSDLHNINASLRHDRAVDDVPINGIY